MKKVIPIILAIVLAVGLGVGGFFLGKGTVKQEKCEVKEESNSELEEIQIGDTHKVELFDEKHELYVEDISLKSEEDIKTFITRADRFTTPWLREVFLDNTIEPNNFKMAYVLSIYGGSEIGGVYFIDKKMLEKEIGKVFANNTIYAEGDASSQVLFGIKITYVCDEKVCMYYKLPGGGAGDSHYSTAVIGSRKDGDNTIYTLKEFYSVFQGGIYDKENGTLLCDTNCPEDIVGTYGDKLATYEMTFDANNKYVSSKKVG